MPRLIPATRALSVFEAVHRLIAVGGMEAVTLRAVARESELSLSSLRHMYASKDFLLASAVWVCVERFQETGRQADHETFARGVHPYDRALRRWLSQLPTTDLLRSTSIAWLEFAAWGRRCEDFDQAQRAAQRLWHQLAYLTCCELGVHDDHARAEARVLAALVDGLRARMCDTIEPLDVPTATATLERYLRSIARPPQPGETTASDGGDVAPSAVR